MCQMYKKANFLSTMYYECRIYVQRVAERIYDAIKIDECCKCVFKLKMIHKRRLLYYISIGFRLFLYFIFFVHNDVVGSSEYPRTIPSHRTVCTNRKINL
jgi:hypothetical protein